MTVTAVTRDAIALTMRIEAEYDAPVERVWQLWEDPRLLERWWGPPTYPATFDELDLRPGGTASYYMTSPEGEKGPRCAWTVLVVEPPHRIEFENGFVDDPPVPNMHMRVDISAVGDMARMSITTTYPSAEAMEQILDMGMEEGLTEAVGQTDALLAEVAAR